MGAPTGKEPPARRGGLAIPWGQVRQGKLGGGV